MSIVSFTFFCFVCCALVVSCAVPRRSQNVVLLAVSYAFCLSFGWPCLLLLVTSTAFNFLVPWFYRSGPRNPRNLPILWAAVGVNLCGLILLRVYRIEAPVSVSDAVPNTLAVVGLSFYTLSAISYLIDVYRGQLARVNSLLNFALAMAWFPRLLVGPIERVQKLLPQITSARIVGDHEVQSSAVLILTGLFRKVVIANWLYGMIPSTAWTQPIQFHSAQLIGFPVLFAFAVYNDFAGYTEIMRGVSGLFGISLSANFNRPFKAGNMTDFWSRWHITLSDWLRDYVYFPLTRLLLKRKFDPRSLHVIGLPILATMLASGLWHGFGWNFVAWALLLGFLQYVERVLAVRRIQIDSRPGRYLLRCGTVGVMFVAAVCFNTSIANTVNYLSILLRFDSVTSLTTDVSVMAIWLIPPLLASAVVDRSKDWSLRPGIPAGNIWLRSSVFGLAVVLIAILSQADSQPAFLYEEF